MSKLVKVPTEAEHWFRLKEPPMDAAAQAATLVEAAVLGTPFCEE